MCGIAGIISKNPSETALKSMLKKQAHRGPDHTGLFTDPGFAILGHNRLSIIDLSQEANQPFYEPSKRYYLTFNGEIYNYKELKVILKKVWNFRTTSDTEVLLAAFITWGKKCLHRLNGMFSFAIWDSKEKKLFAARDRFGVKPFYYSSLSGSFYFASEIKSILAVTQKDAPNIAVWANYFSFGSYGMPDETFYKDVHQLPRSSYLEYSAEKITITRWYNFEKRIRENQVRYNFEEAKEIYLHLLRDSINLRFRADVPAGFNISGGTDSSLLLALVNLYEENSHINAYTFYTGDERYDELPWAREMIAQTQNPLHEVKLEVNEVASYGSFIAKVQEEPFGGIPTLAYAKIFSEAENDGVKVLLDGQGMDEQWAGYDYYNQKENTEKTIQGVGKNSPFRPEALQEDFRAAAKRPVYPEPFDNRLQNLQFRDLFFTKIPRALRFNDRISMISSTELREPFLDYRLVEFAFSQPEIYKIKAGVQKFLLRQILKDLVPANLSNTPKRALQTSQREWLGNDLKTWVESNLNQLKSSNKSGWFNHTEIEKEWKKYLAGDNSSSFHLWQWVNAALLFK